MKVNKVLALMVALAAGAASAAGTTAGTTINNTASANYDNPAYDPAKPTDPITNPKGLTSTSNTVTTTVLPKPSFDVVFKGETPTDGGTQNTLADTTKTYSATPGQPIVTTYTAKNTGNVDLNINLAADTDNSAGASAGQTVVYYPLAADTNNDGTLSPAEIAAANAANAPANIKPITSIVVKADDTAGSHSQDFFQVVTVPTNAAPGAVFGASPEGSVTGTTAETTLADGTKIPANGFSGTLYEQQTTTTTNGTTTIDTTTTPVNTDLQYVKITANTPNLTNTTPPITPTNPNPGTPTPNDPNNPTTPIANPKDPNGNVVIPPTQTGNFPNDPTQPGVPTSGTPNDPTSPNDTPGTSNHPSVPGYIDPTGPGGTTNPTPIHVIDTNNQAAYPPADDKKTDPNNNPDKVTFANVVTNGGTQADTVTIGLPTITNSPANTSATVTAVYIDGVLVPDEDPNTPGYQVTIPAGKAATYTTTVTYPDNDNSATTRPAIEIKVPVTSGLNPNAPAVTTTDTIYPPAMQFGDTTAALGAVTTPTPVQVINPTVQLPAISTTDPLKTTTAGDGTGATVATGNNRAVFGMDVANTGAYNDSYTLSGTVDFGNGPVAVRYFDDKGVELPKNSAGQYITPVVATGAEIKVYAVVDVPAGTAPKDYTLSQTAVSNFSGITVNDTNDIIRVAVAGDIVVAKFTQTTDGQPAAGTQYAVGNPATVSTTAPAASVVNVTNPVGYNGLAGEQANTNYQPGVPYQYQIIAKNGYNKDVTNFALTDTLNDALTYISATCTVNGADIGAPTVAGQKVTCPASTLPAGGTANLTIKVQVK